MPTLAELRLWMSTLESLARPWVRNATPIREPATPKLLGVSSMMGQAQTGHQQAAAFGLGMVAGIDART